MTAQIRKGEKRTPDEVLKKALPNELLMSVLDPQFDQEEEQ